MLTMELFNWSKNSKSCIKRSLFLGEAAIRIAMLTGRNMGIVFLGGPFILAS